jgi:hypothetical protein
MDLTTENTECTEEGEGEKAERGGAWSGEHGAWSGAWRKCWNSEMLKAEKLNNCPANISVIIPAYNRANLIGETQMEMLKHWKAESGKAEKLKREERGAWNPIRWLKNTGLIIWNLTRHSHMLSMTSRKIMKTTLQSGKNSESLLVPLPEARHIKRRETRPLESDIESMLLRSGFQPMPAELKEKLVKAGHYGMPQE